MNYYTDDEHRTEGTVTIPIEKFEAMKQEITRLRNQNQQKTIIKEIIPQVYGKVALVLAVAFLVFLLHYTRN